MPAVADPTRPVRRQHVDQPGPPVCQDVVGLTTAELTTLLGPVPAWRVHSWPPPGTATFEDSLECGRGGATCELIEGVLLEKTMGFWESVLAARVSARMKTIVDSRNLGIVAGADGLIELPEGQTRAPDASFVDWDRLPNGFDPSIPIPLLSPTIAVEVLSASNTQREMERKLTEYFESGTKLVWYVDPRTRTVRVYDAPDSLRTLSADADDTLTAGDVLPEFELSLVELFTPPAPPVKAGPVGD